MKASIRDLRVSTKKIMKAVQSGEEVSVYFHKHAIAKISPIEKEQPFQEDYGFGMWSDNTLTENVKEYSRKLRKGRDRNVN